MVNSDGALRQVLYTSRRMAGVGAVRGAQTPGTAAPGQLPESVSLCLR